MKSRGRRVFRIFVSHCWEQREFYRDLIKMLQDFPRFDFMDRSIPRERRLLGNDEELLEQIGMQIYASDVMLAINTVAASRSAWMHHELRIAKKVGIGIVAVTPNLQRAERISRLVEAACDERVFWRGPQVVKAVRDSYANRLLRERKENAEFRRTYGIIERAPNEVW